MRWAPPDVLSAKDKSPLVLCHAMPASKLGALGLAVLAVACSVVSAFFYMRVAVFMYMNEPQEPAPSRLPAALFAALAVAGLVTLIGGISPGILTAWAVSP